MSRRTFRQFCCLMAVMFFAGPSMGQVPSGAADAAPGDAAAATETATALAQRVADLEAKMVTKEDLDAFRAELLRALENAAQGQQPADDATGTDQPAAKRPMAALPPAETDQVQRMEFDALKDIVLENRTILEEVAENVSNPSGGGMYVPNIRAAMDQSEKFREDMKEVVHKSMDQRGTLVIRNKTAVVRSLRIRSGDKNLVVSVPAGATHREPVAVGTVSTELIGLEGPKNWMLGPPNNSQDIDIRPAPPVIVSPTTSYYYDYAPVDGWWY